MFLLTSVQQWAHFFGLFPFLSHIQLGLLLVCPNSLIRVLLVYVLDDRDTLNSPEFNKEFLGNLLALGFEIGLRTGHIRSYKSREGLFALEHSLIVFLDLSSS